MSNKPRSLFSLTKDSLAAWLAEQGEPAYRAGQILRWVYKRWAASFSEMSDLSAALRDKLARHFVIGQARLVKTQPSADGGTTKYLFELSDGSRIESVIMRPGKGVSLCLSSQTGCSTACQFCATGAVGAGRNLAGHEIVEQAWRMGRDAGGFTHVVFMGMGEPLRNLPGVIEAMKVLTDEDKLAIGARKITLSTCGIAPGIRDLLKSPVHPHLALSLNSPYENERVRLMPGTKRYPLERVLDACAEYVRATGRHLTFEYVLLQDVNDSRQHAMQLGDLAVRMGANVNLIQYNPTPGAPFRSPSSEQMNTFRHWVELRRANVSVRFRRGRDIQAACGQLRAAAPPRPRRPRSA
ncbi:MAG TPA: 23S rRNA (adenine(2503)-C(2))-methyltransferase RlmN [Candidatus Brocadiia bacterium]|nr:23S rRNA (adenine(2503)-C(2))-methyltransferase RlmN [Candidatus Brocadiia bacterium]